MKREREIGSPFVITDDLVTEKRELQSEEAAFRRVKSSEG